MKSNSGEEGHKRRRRSPKPHRVTTKDPRYNIDGYRRGKSIFFESKYDKYSQMVRIDTLEEAKISIRRLEDEYDGAKQMKKKVRLIQVANRAANIAGVGAKNRNYSERERREMAQVSKMYRNLQKSLSSKYAREKKARGKSR